MCLICQIEEYLAQRAKMSRVPNVPTEKEYGVIMEELEGFKKLAKETLTYLGQNVPPDDVIEARCFHSIGLALLWWDSPYLNKVWPKPEVADFQQMGRERVEFYKTAIMLERNGRISKNFRS